MIISMARKTRVVNDRQTFSQDASDASAVKARSPKIKMIKIGTSTGAIFPKEMLAQLKVHQGDTLFTVETPDGILLTPYDPEVEKQLEAGREFMREYRDTFRALAR
jgi:putative addiction module antidote